MYISSASCISPQGTFAQGEFASPVRDLEENRWSCIEPDYKSCITDAGMRRRMSRAVKMGVAAGLRCAELSGVKPDAVITATGLGCLADTEKFLNAITDDATSPNPTPFIQSTFNTVGAQIALLTGNTGYNITYVHRGFSFESALLDVILQLGDGSADNVLVGCFDETTDTSFEIMRRMGFWKKNLASGSRLYDGRTKGTASGEGTAFFMAGNRPPENQPSMQLLGIRFFGPVDNDFSLYREVDTFLTSVGKTTSDIDLLVLGNNGDVAGDDIYRNLISKRFPNKVYCFFKNLCGEYPTASGFSVYLTFGILTTGNIPEGVVHYGEIPRKINNVLIYNHYQKNNHSLMFCQI